MSNSRSFMVVKGNNNSFFPYIVSKFSKYLVSFVDVMLPNTCLYCSQKVGSDINLCSRCWEKVTFNVTPLCDICGYHLDVSASVDNKICFDCSLEKKQKSSAMGKKRYYDRKRSVCIYDGVAKDLVLSLKYFDKVRNAKYMARVMYDKYSGFIYDADIIIPVPIHKKKLLTRMYNQSAFIAKYIMYFAKHNIGDVSLLPRLEYNGIVKQVNNKSQFSLNKKQRLLNVKDVFVINKKVDKANILKGKHILLIDDVITTGATAGACAKVLLEQAGAKRVDVLTFACSKKNILEDGM